MSTLMIWQSFKNQNPPPISPILVRWKRNDNWRYAVCTNLKTNGVCLMVINDSAKGSKYEELENTPEEWLELETYYE